MSTTPAIIELVTSLGATDLPTTEALEQLDPLQHSITKRKKRKVLVPTGEIEKDAEGNPILVGGQPIPKTRAEYQEVNRLAMPLQQLIVTRRAAFMNTGNMNIVAKPNGPLEERLLEMVKRCRTENKMEFKSTEIAERMMSELQVAELWYSEEVERGYWGDISPTGVARMRMKIISPALGDTLLPVFNGAGELVYFARGYKSKKDRTAEIDFKNPLAIATGSTANDTVDHLDIYSKDGVLKFEQVNGVWELRDSVAYTYGKLPIIYYSQAKPEWANVQPLIERVESLWSNFADTIDANASPILYAKGIIKTLPPRGEAGRVINVVPQINPKGEEVGSSDLKYITWDSAPEAVKLESDTLINAIYTCTQTPDISTKGMGELSINSGTGFDRVFIDAHLAAMRHTNGTYGECTQRSLNFLVSACIAIDNTLKPAANLQLAPEFPIFRINDERETIDMLLAATGGEPLLSAETAVGRTGLVQDAEDEFAKIQKEKATLTAAGAQKEVEDEQ